MASGRTPKEVIKDMLECTICLDSCTDPKLLQCKHSYCQQCLKQLVETDLQGLKTSIICPKCRQATPIPADGVAGLPPDFHMNQLNEIATVIHPCSVHGEEELQLYCEQCEKAICRICGLKGGDHYLHDYSELQKAMDKYEGEIKAQLEQMKHQAEDIKTSLARLEERDKEISKQQEEIKDLIKNDLKKRETRLIDQLEQMTLAKHEGLADQKDHLATMLARLNSCIQLIDEGFSKGNPQDVLMARTETVCQVNELTTTPLQLEANTEADIIFSPPTTMCHGKLYSPGEPDPSKFRTEGKGGVVGTMSSVFLNTRNFKDEPCKEAIKSLKCEIVSNLTGTRASCSIMRAEHIQSQYMINYQPTIKGRHQLFITVEGQHIRGSPFSFMVKSSIEKLGTPIFCINEVKEPWGVAVNQRGEVVVTEWDGDCVCRFKENGDVLGKWERNVKKPRGVAVDSDGSILVVDSDNNRIQKFNEDGTLVCAKSTGQLQFSTPTGIVFNATNNKIYVTDTNNHRIQVLNSDLSYSSTVGKKGGGQLQFSHPTGIACDRMGKVYVADTDNHRIQVFTPGDEKFFDTFGSQGHAEGELDKPVGVAIDNNTVYISEYKNNRISVFTSAGQFIKSFGGTGNGPGEFLNPRGLAVDISGAVYVCDMGNHRVQVF